MQPVIANETTIHQNTCHRYIDKIHLSIVPTSSAFLHTTDFFAAFLPESPYFVLTSKIK
jgi:hypothetical protein